MSKSKDISHLKPRETEIEIDDVFYELTIDFGHHCYTDEKSNSDPVNYPHEKRHRSQGRNFSQERYDDSQYLPDIMIEIFNKNHYVVAHQHQSCEERYYYRHDGAYVIFFSATTNVPDKKIKIYVFSAYTVTSQYANFPKKPPKKIRWLLSKRLKKKAKS